MDARIAKAHQSPQTFLLDGTVEAFHLPGGTIYWRTNQPPQKPVRISIPYTEEELRGGDGVYYGDLHNFVPPAVDENTLAVFRYVPRPFGTESETPSRWEKVEGATLDSKNNLVTFETTETGIFGIAGMALPEEARGDTGQLLGGPNGQRILLVTLVVVGGVLLIIRLRRKPRA